MIIELKKEKMITITRSLYGSRGLTLLPYPIDRRVLSPNYHCDKTYLCNLQMHQKLARN